MIVGLKVVRLSDTCGSTFVGLKADDGLSVELQFKSGDERVREFEFGASVMVEVNTALLPRAIRLIEGGAR